MAGTYYAQAREYQAGEGRFQARDIIKGQTLDPLTINEYIYCGNIPFYYYDPNGLFWHIVCGAVTGGVTAATGNATLESLAGGAAETITKGVITGDSMQNIVQDFAVGAVADVAFAKAGKCWIAC